MTENISKITLRYSKSATPPLAKHWTTLGFYEFRSK